MTNGNGLVVGGDSSDSSWPYLTDGIRSVRIIDPFQASYSLGPDLPSPRWYPSLLTLPDGNILIMGGAQVMPLGQHDFRMMQHACSCIAMPALHPAHKIGKEQSARDTT